MIFEIKNSLEKTKTKLRIYHKNVKRKKEWKKC